MITANNFWLWFGGSWLFCGSPFLIIGLYLGTQHIYVNKRLAAEGRTVDGMVLTKAITYSSSSNSRGSRTPTYEVTFRFVTPGDLVTLQDLKTGQTHQPTVKDAVHLKSLKIGNKVERNIGTPRK